MVRVKQSSSFALAGITNGSSGALTLAERAGLAGPVLEEEEEEEEGEEEEDTSEEDDTEGKGKKE